MHDEKKSPVPASQAPCTAPLAWSSPGCVDSVMDDRLAELKRFAEAAQLEVAGPAAAAAAADAKIDVVTTFHPDLGSFARSKTRLSVRDDGSAIVEAHAFLEPEWNRLDMPEHGLVLVHEMERPGSSTALADLLLPTLCLKLKRREIIDDILNGTMRDDSAEYQPDGRAAMRVNKLAWRWAVERFGGRGIWQVLPAQRTCGWSSRTTWSW
jgi:hypothetical protein